MHLEGGDDLFRRPSSNSHVWVRKIKCISLLDPMYEGQTNKAGKTGQSPLWLRTCHMLQHFMLFYTSYNDHTGHGSTTVIVWFIRGLSEMLAFVTYFLRDAPQQLAETPFGASPKPVHYP